KTRIDLYNNLTPITKQLTPKKKLPLNNKKPTTIKTKLQNIKNTYYVNASLQYLTYTPPLTNYILSRKHSQTYHRHKNYILYTIQTHITRTLHNPNHVIQPSQTLTTNFHKNKQKNTHKFLIFTIN
ncbi:U17L6 protein, partial [Podargus strigoides]|nr:U17L6 protein [Podargus strigoides]